MTSRLCEIHADFEGDCDFSGERRRA